MPNLIHVAEYLGGGFGLILLGWMLRWGQHRDDCRANLEEAYKDGWDDAYARVIEDDRKRARAADVFFAAMLGEAAGDMAGPTLLTDTQQLPGQQTMSDEEYEVYAQSHVISQELAALAAEDVPEPGHSLCDAHGIDHDQYAGGCLDCPACRPERGPGHLESTQEWRARMDLEAAQWCARHGLRHESAWAA